MNNEFNILINVKNGQVNEVTIDNFDEETINEVGTFLASISSDRRRLTTQIVESLSSGRTNIKDPLILNQLFQSWIAKHNNSFVDGLVPYVRALEVFSK